MRLAMTIIIAVMAQAASAAVPSGSPLALYEGVKSTGLQANWPGAVDREALVVLRFDVLADGKLANIRVDESGFHEKRFVDEAIRALKRATWQPRRINGQAVDATGLRQPFKFSMPELEPGITAAFRREARKVEELLKKGDFAGGEFHAKWMLSEKVKLNFEYAILQAEIGQTYALMGRIDEAVAKIAMATERPNIPRMEFLQLLDAPPPNKRMRLLAAQGLAMEAMHAYYELAGLQKLPPGDEHAALAEQLTAAIRGGAELRGKVRVGGNGWRQYLSRRSFTLEKVQGDIHYIGLSCSANSKLIQYVPGEDWTVPEGWGPCAADILGEPGLQFEFVEYPDSPTDGAGK
jgi:TonB family protein